MIPVISERRRKKTRRFTAEKHSVLTEVTSAMERNPVFYFPFHVGEPDALLHTTLSIHLLHDLLKKDASALERIFSSRSVSFPASVIEPYLNASRKQWNLYAQGDTEEALRATEYVERKFRQHVEQFGAKREGQAILR